MSKRYVKWLSLHESGNHLKIVKGFSFARIGDGGGEYIGRRKARRIIKKWKEYAKDCPSCSISMGKINTGASEKRGVTFHPNSIQIGCKIISRTEIGLLLLEIL